MATTKRKTLKKTTNNKPRASKKKEEVAVEEEAVKSSFKKKNLYENVPYKRKEIEVSSNHKIKVDENGVCIDILCSECDVVVSVNKNCSCSKDKVYHKMGDICPVINCKNMKKVYLYNNIDKIWFHPDSNI